MKFFVATIVGIVSLSIASLASRMIIDQATVRFRYQVEAIHEEVRGILKNEDACIATVGNITLNSSTNHSIGAIIDQAGNTVYSMGSSYIYGDRTLSIRSIHFTEYQDIAGAEGRALLKIVYNAEVSVSGGELLSRTINLMTSKNGANQLTRCEALGGSNDSLWQRSSANPANIFYHTGAVGIGTSEPRGLLHLSNEDSNGTENDIVLDAYGGLPNQGDSQVIFRRARGTTTSPLSVQANDKLGGIQVLGYGATGFFSAGALQFYAASTGASSSRATISITENGHSAVKVTWSPSGMQTNGGSAEASDLRLKTNIKEQDEDSVWDKLLALKPVTFEWRSESRGTGIQHGFIAQEVEDVWPELVITMEDEMMTKTVDYTDLIAPLVKTVQSLKGLRGLDQEMAEFKDEFAQLKQENEKLRAEIEALKELILSTQKEN